MMSSMKLVTRDFVNLPAGNQAYIYNHYGIITHPLGKDKQAIAGKSWLRTKRKKLDWSLAEGLAMQTGPKKDGKGIDEGKCVEKIPCGSGITVIDCDMLKDDSEETHVSGVEVLMKHLKKGGYRKLTELDTVVVKTPSGGYHIWVRYDPELRNGTCVYRNKDEKRIVKIDVKGRHQRVNIPYKNSGYKYINSPRTTGLRPLSDILPSLWQCLRGPLPQPKKVFARAHEQFVSPAKVEDLLALISESFLSTSHNAYNKWYVVGQALKYCIEDDAEGFRLWDEWSQKGDYDQEAVEKYWDRFSPDGRLSSSPVTYGTLEFFAKEEDPVGYHKFKKQWCPQKPFDRNKVSKKRYVRKVTR